MDQFVRVYFKLCAFFLEREREGKARKINGGTEASLPNDEKEENAENVT